MTEETTKKAKKTSLSYTLKSFSENIRKLAAQKLIDAEDEKAANDIKSRALLRFIDQEF